MICMRIVGIAIFIVLLQVSAAFGQSYSIPEIHVEATITENAVLQIREHRSYQFNGNFSWANYRLPKEGFRDIKGIRISTGDSSFVNENSEEPGTFSVSESNKTIDVKWHFKASDTSRTFTLSYDLTGAVSVGREWSELSWNFLASGREKATDRFFASVRFPGMVLPDSIYTWTRGDTTTFEANTLQGLIEFRGNSVSRNQAAELRTLFPARILTGEDTEVTHPELTLEQVLSEEEARKQEAQQKSERDEYYAEITPFVTLLISLLSILFFILIYRRYGTRFPTRSHSNRQTLVIPGQESPALIGRLMVSQQTTSNHLVATLFELARRGWFIISEEESEKKGFFSSGESTFRVDIPDREPDDKLTRHEEMVVNFVKQRLAEGIDTFDKLFEGGDTTVSKWYSKWTTRVKQEFKEKKWIDPKSYRGAVLNGMAQLVLLACSIFLVIRGTELAIAAIVISALLLACSFFIVRRTEKGENIYKEWKAYSDGLKNADDRTVKLEMLDRHFIYATAFHLSKKQIVTLMESAPESAHTMIPWLIFAPGSQTSITSVATTMSTLSATGSTSFTGVTGAGSGASVGVSGGGASGGAG
ncbi:MAG: DUF2207 domain-containing protein [Balneolaceae bacterium]